MERVTRSIELAESAGTIAEQWWAFERTPRYLLGVALARLRWRAEVLTFEPIGAGTRVTLRIDYEPSGGDAGLSARIDSALEDFRVFLAECRAGAGAWAGLPARHLLA